MLSLTPICSQLTSPPNLKEDGSVQSGLSADDISSWPGELFIFLLLVVYSKTMEFPQHHKFRHDIANTPMESLEKKPNSNNYYGILIRLDHKHQQLLTSLHLTDILECSSILEENSMDDYPATCIILLYTISKLTLFALRRLLWVLFTSRFSPIRIRHDRFSHYSRLAVPR
jgi:hypothetical protein